MKKLLLILLLSLSAVAMAQPTFSALFAEADQEFNKTHANDLKEVYNQVDKLARDYGIDTTSHSELIITNDPYLPKLLNEFYDGCRYNKIDYRSGLLNLKKILVINTTDNYGFLGAINKDHSEIRINAELLKYKSLFRVVFYNLMGQAYGLKVEKNSHNHDIMSSHWFIDQKHERVAEYLHKTHTQEKIFFEKLFEKHPLKSQL